MRWATIANPVGRVRFASDGMPGFARSPGLIAQEQKLFLGDRSERCVKVVRGGAIETLRVEKHVDD